MKLLILIITILATSAFGLTLSAPESGDTFTVSDARHIVAFQFNVEFERGSLVPLGCTTGELAMPLTTLCNEYPAGTLRVVAWGADEFSGDGDVLRVRFKGSSKVHLSDVYFFDEGGYVECETLDGYLSN